MTRDQGRQTGGDGLGVKAPQGRAAELARREQRLKAALKANMARRKAQARARASDAEPQADPGDGAGTNEDGA